MLSAFQAEHPEVRVRATVSDSGLVLKEIEKGRATLGLVGQKIDNPNLEYRTIGSDCLVLIVHSKHPSAGRKTVSLEPLKRERLIIRESGSGSRRALEAGLARAGTSLAALNVTLELGSNSAIKDAVSRGLGVAFLSQLAVRRELDSRSCTRSPSKASISRGVSTSSMTAAGRCLQPRPPSFISSKFIRMRPADRESVTPHKLCLWRVATIRTTHEFARWR